MRLKNLIHCTLLLMGCGTQIEVCALSDRSTASGMYTHTHTHAHTHAYTHAYTHTNMLTPNCRGVMEALAPLLMVRMHTLTVSELVIALWSYGIFQHRPASEPRFLDALSTALVQQLRPGTHTQTYSLVIKSYANLRWACTSVCASLFMFL
jgi:hypothetical protein